MQRGHASRSWAAVFEQLLADQPRTRPHTILIGQIERTRLGDDQPAIYFRRGFHALPAAS
jgi:flavin reductase (DIM6/NTAB) family NADH-FMN oxidoreductase RutF